MCAAGSWTCCCQTSTTWRSRWTGGMLKLINPCSSASSSMVCTQLVWWVLVHERDPSGAPGRVPELWPCTTATQGQAVLPGAGSCSAAGSFQWCGRHTVVSMAMTGLLADSGLPGAACSHHVKARRKAQSLSWHSKPWRDVSLGLPGATGLFAPSCTHCRCWAQLRACAASQAGLYDGKPDLSLCLLPRGCRAISSFWESVLSFWG